MRPLHLFNVSPRLPANLEPLRQLAYNLHWDWHLSARDLFRRLDAELWETCRHNPVLILGRIRQSRLQEMAEDEGFLAHMSRATQELNEYLQERSWYRKQRPEAKQQEPQDCYAYFSAEFGLTDCLPIYSGGLGVLAGDHLKSASDLGLPLVGVGLLYQEGYFAQYLNADGWQQERYPINDFYNMPLHLEKDANGEELRIAVDYPGRVVYARVWRVQVGTIPLYLLDTNIAPNNPYDHDITDELYGGDLEMRIDQEIMLGIGGIRMLRALGYNPTVFHLNEGHSALLTLERIRLMMQEHGLTFAEAQTIAQASQVFTTHTPVPAGIDLFGPDQIMHAVGNRYAEIFGLSREEFLALGRSHTGDFNSPFSMATLALKMASFVNGVSRLHGQVSRRMFGGIWINLPVEEVPIGAITNGVHARSYIAKPMKELYDRYLGPNWAEAPADSPRWQRVATIPNEELWRTHEHCRSQLILFVRERLQQALRDRGAAPHELVDAAEVLDPFALTIGFARRFATYKRATLFLRDLERIQKILLEKKHKVQFVIAGKAHPKDNPGKELIREVVHFSRTEGIRGSVVFVPDYDIHVARLMVAGCDVWLNTPRRPYEASGTSGMKAAVNGIPNLSVPDGWWDEADQIRTGWSIGQGETYESEAIQDDVEAAALYDLLEQEVIPLFYDRDSDSIPRRWVEKMKDVIMLNCPCFNTTRMVSEYATQAYFPVSDRYRSLIANNFAHGKALTTWHKKVFEHWYEMKIESVDVSTSSDIQVGQVVQVKARLSLGALAPADVQVELYQGEVNEQGEIINGQTTTMTYHGMDDRNHAIYLSETTYDASGFQGLSVRALPNHPHLSSPYACGLILWAS
jgi:starch phosphorylase